MATPRPTSTATPSATPTATSASRLRRHGGDGLAVLGRRRCRRAGIPVTYAYISDAHDGHGNAGNIHFAYGPGEAGYVQQLADYDQAFGKFFDAPGQPTASTSRTRCSSSRSTRATTSSVTHRHEAGCDGVTTPCTYNRVGEINADLRRML